MAMLLERRKSREQSSWASVWRRLSYNVALTGRDADCPHTHNSRYPHHPFGLHQSYENTRSKVLFRGRYIGPPMVTSNTLRNIQTDAALTSLRGPPTQMTLTLGWGEEYAHWSDTSHSPITERILAETDAYCTCELVFFPLTAMKSCPGYYTQVRIICDIYDKWMLTMLPW